jgi:transcriptional regulator with XRE-family HTH domain
VVAVNLRDAITRALTDQPAPPQTRAELMRAVRADAPTQRAAAAQAGVSARTWQRWAAGTQNPSAASLGRLRAAGMASSVPRERRERMRTSTGPDLGVIKADIQVSNDRRTRRIRPGNGLRAGWAEPVLNAYAADGPDAAASAYVAALESRGCIGAHVEIHDVDELHF